MKYRTDIDGLRAIAVLAVVSFHYGLVRRFGGGYVGVDIFFVISGFLITRIIFDDMAAGRYRIVDFYDRRARRILPALFAMLGVTLVATYFLRFSTETADVARSAAASVFSISNVFFYSISSYFDDKLASNPLLHTWSLSVEEQFYVLFPILMIPLRKIARRHQIRVLLLVAVVSFVASVIQTRSNPSSAFYLVPFRAWELMLGGIVAIADIPRLRRRIHIETTAIAGLAMVLASIVVYTKNTSFPGMAALLPCAGAAAILYAGGCGANSVSRGLSWGPLRFVGLVSYSLYLWHWPIYVFYSERHDLGNGSLAQKWLMLMGALAIATLSWHFVERPFRYRRDGARSPFVLAVAAIGMGTLATAAFVLPVAAQAWRPASPQVRAMLGYIDYPSTIGSRHGKCFLSSKFNDFGTFDKATCLSLSSTAPNVLIIGDSHGAHLWWGYARRFPEVNFLQATASGCKPLVGAAGEKWCTDMFRYMLAQWLPAHHVDEVIISARWRDEDARGLLSTVGLLTRYANRVVISGPIDEFGGPLPRLLAYELSAGEPLGTVAYDMQVGAVKRTDETLSSLPWPARAQYVSVYGALCTPRCELLARTGAPLQFDYGHLTMDGSLELADRIGPSVLGDLARSAVDSHPAHAAPETGTGKSKEAAGS